MIGDIANLRWYRGPWQWVTGGSFPYWSAPAGAVGSIDLRSLPDQAAAETSAGLGLFVSYDQLPSEYDLLGVGSPRDIKPGQKTKDAIPKRSRFVVQGDDLLSMLRSCLMDGSDPTGGEYAKPLMPGHDMRFGFCCGPWQDWERTAPWNAHWDKVQDVLRADFATCFADAQAGLLKDSEHHRRVLDTMCEKYRVDDWKSFVPLALRREIPGRLPHETTIADDFNRANAGTLGSSSEGWSWTTVLGTFGISGNLAASAAADSNARAESDLSSSDQYAQATATSGVASGVGVVTRFQSSGANPNRYLFISDAGVNEWAIFKSISAAYTKIANSATGYANPSAVVHKGESNGSSQTLYTAATQRCTVTDTAISSGTRCGLFGWGGQSLDDFSAADIAAGGGIIYTQFEGGTRGLHRGMWHRSAN